MKSIFKVCFILLIMNSHAQTYDVNLYGDKKRFFNTYQDKNILISNNNDDTLFSGVLAFNSESNGSVTIKPEIGYTIRIIPLDMNQLTMTPVTGTQIGTRPPIGSGGLNKNANIELYPNPAISTIQLKSTENIIGYKIYNSQGMLKSDNSLLKSKQFSANINNLSPGIYYTVILLENGQTISKQFIKQ